MTSISSTRSRASVFPYCFKTCRFTWRIVCAAFLTKNIALSVHGNRCNNQADCYVLTELLFGPARLRWRIATACIILLSGHATICAKTGIQYLDGHECDISGDFFSVMFTVSCSQFSAISISYEIDIATSLLKTSFRSYIHGPAVPRFLLSLTFSISNTKIITASFTRFITVFSRKSLICPLLRVYT